MLRTLAVGLLLVACAPPSSGTLSLRFDTKRLPDEVAFQDGDGPWRVIPLPEGTADVEVTDPDGRYGLAITERHRTDVEKTTVWQRGSVQWGSWASDAAAEPDPVVPEELLSFELDGLTLRQAYIAWYGEASFPFTAVSSSQRVWFPINTGAGPLVLVEDTTNDPQLYLIARADRARPNPIGPGASFIEEPDQVTGLPPTSFVRFQMSCVAKSEAGSTSYDLEGAPSVRWGRQVALRPPAGAGRCQTHLGVWTETGDGAWLKSTWLTPGRAEVFRLPPPLQVSAALSTSWAHGLFDDDALVTLEAPPIHLVVRPSFRRGASQVALGDTTAAPRLAAASRSGSEPPSVHSEGGDWWLYWMQTPRSR